MTEALARGCSSDSTQREPSNEFQHDRISMVFRNLCVLCAFDESSLSIGSVKRKAASIAEPSNSLRIDCSLCLGTATNWGSNFVWGIWQICRGQKYKACNRSWHLPGVAPCSPYKRRGVCGSFYGYPASKVSLDTFWIWRLCSYSPSFPSFS